MQLLLYLSIKDRSDPRVRAASRVEELGMKYESIKPKTWTRPELRRLGRIEDVAGAQTPVAQAANTKS